MTGIDPTILPLSVFFFKKKTPRMTHANYYRGFILTHYCGNGNQQKSIKNAQLSTFSRFCKKGSGDLGPEKKLCK
jgi:hypothetical protein